jgi:type IV pilus assembly protein PilB
MTELSKIKPIATLASYLIQDGLLDINTAEQASLDAVKQGLSFLQYLIANKLLDANITLEACAKRFGLATFDLQDYNSTWLESINQDIIHQHRVIPLYKENNALHIGISDPTEQHALEIIMFHTGLRTIPILVAEDKLDRLLSALKNKYTVNKSIEKSLFQEVAADELHLLKNDNNINKDEPIIKFVDQILENAFQQSASDIHIEPYATACRIRYRRDGLLYQANEIPATISARLMTRLKVMAKLDITERRLPQDGRMQWNDNDIRINSCPTQHGEKIVLRLLNSNKLFLDIQKLGLSEIQKNIFIEKISAPHGLILVTGPTGSGKSQTLYAALNYLNTTEKNLSSIEDPVEIEIPGINQININQKIDLTFSTMLRTLLRQDPDIIMVGEIRDRDTATITLQAAETGHLVLSTLHTNSAFETINRFNSMNIAAANYLSALSLIISQRLVRVLCALCKIIDTSTYALPKTSTYNPGTLIFRAQGCAECLNGYKGRTAIYELLPINQKIGSLILSGANHATITSEAALYGYTPLLSSALSKLYDGTTSFAEIKRVLLT